MRREFFLLIFSFFGHAPFFLSRGVFCIRKTFSLTKTKNHPPFSTSLCYENFQEHTRVVELARRVEELEVELLAAAKVCQRAIPRQMELERENVELKGLVREREGRLRVVEEENEVLRVVEEENEVLRERLHRESWVGVGERRVE